MEGACPVKWNLRLAAANRGIWKASELQRMLADRGLVISAGKMSGLWSGEPNVVKLRDLDVICAVLGCGVQELLIPEPGTVTAPQPAAEGKAAVAGAARPAVVPRAPAREVAAAAMNCLHCEAPLPAASRRDRRYCNNNCRAWHRTGAAGTATRPCNHGCTKR